MGLFSLPKERIKLSADSFSVMEIRTYTNFWNLERKFYSFFDVSLPVPISLTVAGLFIGTGIPWWFLMWAVGLQATNGLMLALWVFPPAILAYFGAKPIFEQKTLFQYLATQIQYLMQDKRYKSALNPDLEKYGEELRMEKEILLLPAGNSASEEPQP